MGTQQHKLTKVDFILPFKEQNSWIAFLTKQLAHSFEQLGVEARLLVSPKNRDPKPFLEDLYAHAPDCTICFNGVLPDDEGHFLADLIEVPHFAILTESPNNFLELAKSSYTTTLSPDQQYLDILKEGGCARTFFFPLAAPINKTTVLPLKERKGSILMVPAWLDGSAVRDFWEKNLPQKMVEFLEGVVSRSLSNPSISYFHAFQIVLGEQPIADQKAFLPWTTFALFDQIETILRETDIVELLTALKGIQIDLAVEVGTSSKWQKRLGDVAAHCTFHEGLNGEEILYMMGQTKIFLASSPQFKFGTTGDLYTALMMGAYTFHNRAEFLEWGYRKDRGVYFYPYNNREAILAKAKEVLANPSSFQEEVNKGRQQVVESETWLNRAKLLIDFITPVLQQLPNQPKSMK